MKVVLGMCLAIGMLMHSAQGVGKVLKSGCVSFLNESLAEKPSTIARLLMAYKRIVQVHKELESTKEQAKKDITEEVSTSLIIQGNGEECCNEGKRDTLIDTTIAYMLEPIKDFFAEVKKRHWEVRTILVESLEVPFKGNLDIISLTSQQDQDSFILRFLNSNENDITTFLQGLVEDQATLKKLSKELYTFIGDLQESFSPTVKKQYLDFVAALKLKKENKEEESVKEASPCSEGIISD